MRLRVEVFIANVLQREASINLSWVRVLRLFRIFRIFKVSARARRAEARARAQQGRPTCLPIRPCAAPQVSKLAYGFRIVMAAMRMSMTSFSVLVFFMLILVILSSSLMYMFEGTDPPHPMQPRPELFATIPDCMWWAVVTITTVGYGDAVPASPAGKVIATGTMCLGLLSIALPVTVLGSNFTKVMDMYEQELDMYDAADSDGNGNVSEDELRFFLFTKRQQGSVSDEFKQTALQLMRKYDEQNKGVRTRRFQLVRAVHRSLSVPFAGRSARSRRLSDARRVQPAREGAARLARADAPAHDDGADAQAGRRRAATRAGTRAVACATCAAQGAAP